MVYRATHTFKTPLFCNNWFVSFTFLCRLYTDAAEQNQRELFPLLYFSHGMCYCLFCFISIASCFVNASLWCRRRASLEALAHIILDLVDDRTFTIYSSKKYVWVEARICHWSVGNCLDVFSEFTRIRFSDTVKGIYQAYTIQVICLLCGVLL